MAVFIGSEQKEISEKLPNGVATRMFERCNQEPQWTGDLAYHAQTVHPAAYKKTINDVLVHYGARLVCKLPTPLKLNRWGEKSRSHLWMVVRFDTPSANDSVVGTEKSSSV